jgi:hypothetical protein
MFNIFSKKEDGAVLVLSIILITVLIILIGVLSNSINNNIAFTKRHEDSTKAFYRAEAGIEHGRSLIEDDFKQLKIDIEDNLNGEEYALLYNSADGFIYKTLEAKTFGNYSYTFKSTGESRGVEREIIATFTSKSGLFPNAIESELDLNYGQNITIDGTIAAGGEYVPHNNNTTLTFINDGGYSEPTGGTFHDLFDALYDYDTNPDEWLDASDFDISILEDSDADDVIKINGDITINQSFTSNKTLIVDGNITVDNNITINKNTENNDTEFTDDYLTVIVGPDEEDKGDFTAGNSFMMQGFIYAMGDVTFGNQGNEPYLNGSIYTRENFSVGNPNALAEGDFIYDETALDGILDLIDFGDDEERIFTLANWEE